MFWLITATSEAESRFSGYIKSWAVAQDQVRTDILVLDTTFQSQNSIRLMWEDFSGNRVFQIHYEVSPVLLSRTLPLETPTFNVISGNYRLQDISRTLTDSTEKNQVYQNLDRLNLQWQFKAGDLTIGRQAISFGSARLINPTDIFLPFDVQTFNQEYRTGVDAVRFQAPLGDLGEFDIGIVLGDDAHSENSAAFVQLRENIRGMDLQFSLTRFGDETLAGGGIQTSLGDFGFWFELAGATGEKDYLRTSIGTDYAFTENTFMMVEYHFNGAGASNAENYLNLGETIPYRRGGVFLLGKNYLMPSLTIQLTPLWSSSLQAIINLDDPSAFIMLAATWNARDNLYADFGLYHFTGKKLTTNNAGLPFLRSEYGTNPDMLYASLRYYF